ncbi:GlxA family transcriptional regulator [Rhizorhabdus dicambivorans]|uniref:GlxA family transcriptional regulator n=1 Tax=Rhizorhabdus dicambivorans TaxID=1850238 RepID=A0A2A4FSH7_9SPHN|nr:GlxA family transcriptional regulator [Rhizorhabdus dicambivorans]ATE65779.1 GlxA family transcriptional regulator [Rhizorhabdus dicambivorans]PCE41137.1 GlxA family transcriptional regulator [Rhizorhabdus dicambivorans]
MSSDDLEEPHKLGLFLTRGHALMSYASVLEPFRVANDFARKPLYQWRHISVDGQPVLGSHGTSTVVDSSIQDAFEYDTVFVFAGGDPFLFDDRAAFGWLRRQARSRVRMAGVSGGSVLLAKAGLLDGYRATVHWEHEAMFQEFFPSVMLEPGLFAMDRRRMTCAGGIAGLDFAIDLVERDYGVTLAKTISDWFIRTDPRHADHPQRMSLGDRYGVLNDKVVRVLAEMEANVEEPRSRERLARIAGVSLRQLERLFAKNLGRSIEQTYLAIRLEQAFHLVRSTGMSVTEISVACGFGNASHFTRSFRGQFGLSPSAVRKTRIAVDTRR